MNSILNISEIVLALFTKIMYNNNRCGRAAMPYCRPDYIPGSKSLLQIKGDKVKKRLAENDQFRHEGIFSLTVNLKLLLILFAVFLFAALPTWGGMNEWTSNGPNGGRVYSLAISPNFAIDGIIFAGTNGGGLYISTNGGTSWTQVGFPLTFVSSLAISPNYSADSTLFAESAGAVFKSTNGGASWTQVGSDLVIRHLAFSPNYATDGTIFAGAFWDGVYKSTNGGTSWTQVGLPDTNVCSLAISPNFATDNTIFVGTQSGVYKSTNGGTSWNQVNGLDIEFDLLAISLNYATDSTLFAGFSGVGGSGTWWIYKSINGGTSWTQVGFPYTVVPSLAISPNYSTDSTIFLGTYNGVYKSTNGGANWTIVDSGFPAAETIVQSLSISPSYSNDSTIFAGTDSTVLGGTEGGVFSYTFPVIQLPRTGQTTSYAVGDDGDIQAGVAWPSPRFTDNGDQTITDNLTGLMWTKDAGTPTVGSCTGGTKTWQGALDYVACLNSNNYLGHSDWRLPNINELHSLIDKGTIGLITPRFTNVPSAAHWSSTTDTDILVHCQLNY